MKTKVFTTLLIMLCATLNATAAPQDSVYIKAFGTRPQEGLRLAYSADQRTWVNVGDGYDLFRSDFGTWGAEKKMHTPVLSYRDGLFHAEFIPNPQFQIVATTESEDLIVWKPQEYIKMNASDFEKKKEELQRRTGKETLRVPYDVVKRLITHTEAVSYRNQLFSESMRDDDTRFANVASVKGALHIDLNDRKPISPELVGIFFEDINYAADGGLYAELLQNRDFEFTPESRDRHAKFAWHTEGEGIEWEIGTEQPIHQHNAHYSTLKMTTADGRLVNEGWDGIALKAKAKYDLSLFLRGTKGKVRVSLREGRKTLASAMFTITPSWQQQKCVLVPSASATAAVLVIEPLQAGRVDIDFVSLFPQDTFKGRKNGLRKDLAQTLANLKPQFVRFPGGCATHGQGIDNIYHWQATVGELWERQQDFNIWGYHQSRGLGFFEYFQFCEDIGAQPLPVLAAGVPCQNSSKGGPGQNGGIPFAADLNGQPSPYQYNGHDLTMESYLQELIDLIEWANGDPKTSPLARLRAKAGHPKPFNMKYLGIGNEDLLGDVFNRRFDYLYEGLKKAHPEITVVGTVGPFWEGSDYEYGWRHARELGVSIVDEHYYNAVGWYINNQTFYDHYPRTGTKVYLGEWASHGNRIENALAEAIHFTNLERNGDVVVMSSYAPLLAKEGHTQWNPDLIYFNNTEVKPTVNYYVQMLTGQNAGDEYIYAQRTVEVEAKKDGNGRARAVNQKDVAKRISCSVVADKETGDIIIKLVNALPTETAMTIDLGSSGSSGATATVSCLAGNYDDHDATVKVTSQPIAPTFTYSMPKYSFSVIRITK